MKFTLTIVALTLFSFYALAASPPKAREGTESSGGGPSIFCPNSTSPAGIAQLYDFFEGRLRRNLNVPVTNSLPKEQQIEHAFKKLEGIDYAIAQDVRVELLNIIKNISYLPDGILMTSVNDLGGGEAPIVPVNCQLAYAAYFESSGQLSIARLLYDRFTETEKAALLMHEALYSVAREMSKQVDSRSTRIVNAFIFSTEKQPSDLVKSALATMRMYGNLGLVIPVILDKATRALSLRARCEGITSDNDRFFWGAEVSLWGAGSISGPNGPFPYEGGVAPRISIKKGTPTSAEAVIRLNETTRTVVFERNELSRSGVCARENLDLYYGSQKLISLPPDTNRITLRLFPTP
jgi:hypothetical protein